MLQMKRNVDLLNNRDAIIFLIFLRIFYDYESMYSLSISKYKSNIKVKESRIPHTEENILIQISLVLNIFCFCQIEKDMIIGEIFKNIYFPLLWKIFSFSLLYIFVYDLCSCITKSIIYCIYHVNDCLSI